MCYRRLRAPREDGEALIEPPISEAPKLVAANRALAQTWDRDSGLPLAKWREQARTQLLFASASGQVRTTGAEVVTAAQRPLVLAGHQPTLFHPGVWFKNFLLDRIARDVSGTGVDLVIDNDTVRHAGIRVPLGSPWSPALVNVPLDAATDEMPLEERRVIDPVVFRSFGARVRGAFEPVLAAAGKASGSLLVDRLWQHARQIVREETAVPPAGEPDERPQAWPRQLLGDCLAEARHRLERDYGLATCTGWLRSVCSGWPFAYFVHELLRRWCELHPIYNATLAEYRAINHIRSRRQPAPDLAVAGDWLEAPFWIWTARQPQRRRAFVRNAGKGWELTDRAGLILTSETLSDAGDSALDWTTAEFKADVKVRPRALITTMYARLVLSDLFVHGIGGAKYDELTDALIRRFFGIEPPAYVTATATFRLPIERPIVAPEDVRQIERRIRDIDQHPDSFVDDLAGKRGEELKKLAMQKQKLIAARWQEKQKKVWHDRVTTCNERMTALLADVRDHLLKRREMLLADLHAANLLGSREFSFVLFPEETLPRQLLDLCMARP